MMLKPERYREITASGAIIHASAGNGTDYMLCGYAEEGECQGNDDEHQPTKLVTRGRISCPDCVHIIRYCKSIAASTVEKVKP